MTPTNTVSLDSIRLRLIEGKQAQAQGASNESTVTLSKEGVSYLIKSLAYADTAFASEIEHLLVQIGELAVPQLIKGLLSTNMTVRSVCAMALIRLGPVAEKPLIEASMRATTSRWIFNFLFEELGLPQYMVQPVQVVQSSSAALSNA